MRKMKIYVICMIMAVILAGCGSKGISEEDLAEYVGGIKVVDLLDENSYEQNGDKMVKALEAALNATPNDFHMLKKDINLTNVFSDAIKFEETFDQSECNCYYIGGMKDGKPHGYGVITSGYDSDSLIHYIGEFKKGEVDNCYGMKLESYWGITSIRYEGVVAYLDQDGLYAVPADGERTITYEFDEIFYFYDEDPNISYDTMGLSGTNVAKCFPKYIGEIKDGNYSGEGIQYYPDGTLGYEGEFKNGKYHGDGKLYTREGKILKEGTFKHGELEDGEYYRENE